MLSIGSTKEERLLLEVVKAVLADGEGNFQRSGRMCAILSSARILIAIRLSYSNARHYTQLDEFFVQTLHTIQTHHLISKTTSMNW